jgi:hypothetical protein
LIKTAPYNLQNGNLLDLTCGNDDICIWAVLVMVAIWQDKARFEKEDFVTSYLNISGIFRFWANHNI